MKLCAEILVILSTLISEKYNLQNSKMDKQTIRHETTKSLPYLQKFEAKRKLQARRMEKISTTFFVSTCLLLLFQMGMEVTGEYIPPGPKYKCPLPLQIWPCRCLSSSDEGLTLSCHDVSTAILSAALAFPTGYKIPVENLTVTMLNTEKLYGNIFSNLNCTTLRIENSPLKEISSDVFIPLKDSLIKLEIINSQLDEMPVSALQELENLVTLTIDQHNISILDKPITGMGNLQNIHISNGNITEFKKDTFASLGKLVRLDLHGNNLKTIPSDSFKNLKQLEYFDISFNQFHEITAAHVTHLSKLTWFNASHNEISEFKRGLFARNTQLRVLHLNHNKLKKLDATIFRGMRLLVRLFLSDNQISDIGRGAFSSLTKIATIDLARNRLTVVDHQMFNKLPFVEYIMLEGNAITKIQAGAFNELTDVVLNVSHNQIKTIEKGAFVSCVNMKSMDMSYNQIDNFTKGAFDDLTYTREWKLEYNKLVRTQDIPLKFMSGLAVLNVSHNSLQEVGKNTFPKLYELHTVDFSHNNLSKIQGGIFGNLFTLRYLDLRHNNFTDLTSSAFGPIPTLLELHLDHNRLKTVSQAVANKLVSLRELTMSNNKLKKVPQIPGSLNDLDLSNNEINSLSRAWPQMNALQRLDLSGNDLGGNLGPGSFENLGALSSVKLARNNISEIPVEALSDMRTVQYIDLSSNNITTLPKAALGRLPIVFTLLLSNNSISTIEYKAFDGLLQLLHLDLSQNALKTIPVGALTSLVSLRKLNLSRNALERTDNGTNCIFEENLSLETLDLSYNKIAGIYPHTFPELPWTNYKLANVNLSHNEITLISREILRGTKTLKTLDLSFNRISEIRPKVLGNITTLQSLDLSSNQIAKFDPSIIGPPPLLTELKIARNNLAKFPVEILSKAPLTFVDISSNRLKMFNLEYLTKIKNGSRIILTDNAIMCDCRIILLQRYFYDLRPELTNFTSEYFQDYEDFKCKIGREGSLQNVKGIPESDLICDEDIDPPVEIPEYADVELRSFTQVGQNVEMRWRVTSKMDVLGFKILITGEDPSDILQTENYGYNVRAAGILLPRGATNVCLVPSFSRGKGPFQTDFSGVKKICRTLNTQSITSGYAKASGSDEGSSTSSRIIFTNSILLTSISVIITAFMK